jgi:hypothetical protein
MTTPNDPKGAIRPFKILLDQNGNLFYPWWEMDCNWMSFRRYYKCPRVDVAKGRRYPHLRGGILPSIDIQVYGGLAINWLGFRLRFGITRYDRGWIPKPTCLRPWNQHNKHHNQ